VTCSMTSFWAFLAVIWDLQGCHTNLSTRRGNTLLPKSLIRHQLNPTHGRCPVS